MEKSETNSAANLPTKQGFKKTKTFWQYKFLQS
jgi:hypothetical protein